MNQWWRIVMIRVLVTGADGFIGSHLTEMLVAKGYQVKALSQYNSFNNEDYLDIKDLKKLIKNFEKKNK